MPAAAFLQYYKTLPPPPPRIYVLISLCCFLASLNFLSLQAQNAPPWPSNVLISGVTSSGAVLHWNKSPGATSYDVFRNPGPGWVNVGDVSSYTYTGLTANTQYDLAVRAKNAGGTSPPRLVDIFTLTETGTFVLRAPSAPGNPLVSDITHESAVLSWTRSYSASSYEVNGGALSRWVDIGNVDRYTFICLAGNTEYTLQIRSKNSMYTSHAVRLTLTTLADPPGTNRSAACDPYPRPRKKSKQEPTATPTFTPSPKPTVQTLKQLPAAIQVNNWLDGAQGRRVGSDAISRADLIAQGVVDAVDVYGYVTPGVEVCFKRPGRVVFLDAAYAPRRLSDLPSYQRAGMTCAIIDRPGTVVLLRSDSPPPQEPQPPPENTPPANTNPGRGLGECEVQPFANLKFRQSPPDGLVLGVTGRRDWLPASDKRDGYFKVSLWGIEGWISGAYVHTRGHCGA